MKDVKKLTQVRKIVQKLKELPDPALQRIQGYADGVLDARKEHGEKKSA